MQACIYKFILPLVEFELARGYNKIELEKCTWDPNGG